MGIRKFWPTRWTVRGDSVESIVKNLKQLWDETRLDPDIKGRIIGVKTQMTQYKVLFGLKLHSHYCGFCTLFSSPHFKFKVVIYPGNLVHSLSLLWCLKLNLVL